MPKNNKSSAGTTFKEILEPYNEFIQDWYASPTKQKSKEALIRMEERGIDNYILGMWKFLYSKERRQ